MLLLNALPARALDTQKRDGQTALPLGSLQAAGLYRSAPPFGQLPSPALVGRVRRHRAGGGQTRLAGPLPTRKTVQLRFQPRHFFAQRFRELRAA